MPAFFKLLSTFMTEVLQTFIWYTYVSSVSYPSQYSLLSIHMWRCGPCKVMAPRFQELSEKFLDVVFLKLDCNQENKVSLSHWQAVSVSSIFFQWSLWSISVLFLQPLAKELGIRVVPTFKILKDSKVVKEVTGAKFDDLVVAIETVKSS